MYVQFVLIRAHVIIVTPVLAGASCARMNRMNWLNAIERIPHLSIQTKEKWIECNVIANQLENVHFTSEYDRFESKSQLKRAMQIYLHTLCVPYAI